MDEVADDLLLPSVIYARPSSTSWPRSRSSASPTSPEAASPATCLSAPPDSVSYGLDRSTWDVPPIFGRIQELGGVGDEEMAKVFNLGIGMVVVVRPEDGDRTVDLLRASGHDARAIGEVTPGG